MKNDQVEAVNSVDLMIPRSLNIVKAAVAWAGEKAATGEITLTDENGNNVGWEASLMKGRPEQEYAAYVQTLKGIISKSVYLKKEALSLYKSDPEASKHIRQLEGREAANLNKYVRRW